MKRDFEWLAPYLLGLNPKWTADTIQSFTEKQCDALANTPLNDKAKARARSGMNWARVSLRSEVDEILDKARRKK
jgi:hypothetical protein